MDFLDIKCLWPDNTMNYWTSKNIKLAPGTSLKIISDAEKILSFIFPYSFKLLYQKVNGFVDNNSDENMISVWPIDRILEEYGRYPKFVGFSDFLINSHVYGFLKNRPGIFKNYDLADPHIEKIAETFEDAIGLINTNSDLLY